jgi:hypothetical protein
MTASGVAGVWRQPGAGAVRGTGRLFTGFNPGRACSADRSRTCGRAGPEGITRLFDLERGAAGRAALAAARAAGLTTSVDPQAAPALAAPQRAADFLDDVRGVDLLLPNTDELDALGGTVSAKAREMMQDPLFSGEAGAFAYLPSQIVLARGLRANPWWMRCPG